MKEHIQSLKFEVIMFVYGKIIKKLICFLKKKFLEHSFLFVKLKKGKKKNPYVRLKNKIIFWHIINKDVFINYYVMVTSGELTDESVNIKSFRTERVWFTSSSIKVTKVRAISKSYVKLIEAFEISRERTSPSRPISL